MIPEIYFSIAGFEGTIPVIINASLSEILENKESSEAFSAIAEEISNPQVFESLLQFPGRVRPCRLNRDSESPAYIMRISETHYNILKRSLCNAHSPLTAS